MNITLISLDFYNKSFYVQKNNDSYLWPSENDFRMDTSYPFEDTVLLSYELERNLFVVERLYGVNEVGQDSPEIKWITDNLSSIIETAIQRSIESIPVITVDMVRKQKLFETDWILQRKQEHDLLGIPSDISNQYLVNILTYRQALRDITKTYAADSPAEVAIWPEHPSV